MFDLAQAALGQETFWTTLPGVILSWAGFAVAVAAGVKAVQFLVHSAIEGRRWGWSRYKERLRVNAALEELTSIEGWPNGATSMKQSHEAVYDKVVTLDEKVSGIQLDMRELKTSVEQAITDQR